MNTSTDRVALYNAADGDNWVSDRPLGEWHGVRTAGNGPVTGLDLSHNQLSGAIPPELGSLTNLERLLLAFNQLSGEIPPAQGSLANLAALGLGGNSSLSGPLPSSFTGLTSLNSLSLTATGLCAPTDAAFQAWLGGIAERFGVVNCGSDPVFDRYDANKNGKMERSEVIAAINDYLDGAAGITRADVIRRINLYLDG